MAHPINQINPFENVHTGYWGPVDSNIDWCELNYAYVPWVAELANTVTSFPIFLIAMYGLSRCRSDASREIRYHLCYATVGMVGLGSMAFHGMLRRHAQALDELPMLYASLCFIYLAIDIHAYLPILHPQSNPLDLTPAQWMDQWRWKAVLIAAGVAQTYIYYAMPQFYALFLISFIGTLSTLFVYTAYHLFYLPGKNEKLVTGELNGRNGGVEMSTRDLESQGMLTIGVDEPVPTTVTVKPSSRRPLSRSDVALAQSLYIKGAVLYTIATLLWLTENTLCGYLPYWAYFHAAWHLLSGTATYYLCQTQLAWRAAVHQRAHAVIDALPLQFVQIRHTL